MGKTFIYGLVSKKSPNEVRYVGKADNLEYRLKRHIHNTKYNLKKNKKLTHKDNWIIKHNYEIDFVLLEECDYNEWQDREKFYISKFQNLTNTSEGGLGGSGIKYKLTYDEVKIWVKNNLNVTSKNEWCKNIEHIPKFIPYCPREVYLNKGWVSWGDFLGTGRIWDNYVNYTSYVEAKKIIKNLQINSRDEYKKFIKGELIPKTIPSRPERYYKNRGWISWGDFLGTGRIANQLKNKKDPKI
jgi:hypothetical protein